MAARIHEAIAMEAYGLAERRGFEPGHEERDWMEAEERVDRVHGRVT